MGSRSAVGVNIASTCVRAAELVSAGSGSVRLAHYGQVPLPVGAVADGEVMDTAAVATALRELWKGAGIKSQKVVLGVSNHRVLVRQVELPAMEAGERRSSLRFQVADLVPMSLDDSVLDFIPLEEFDKSGTLMQRGLLVVAAQDTVLGAISAAKQAGLKPVQVDLTPFAVLRSVARAGRDGQIDGAEAVVDIGAGSTNIVVHENGAPRFVRVLMMGADAVTAALIDRADLSPEAAAEAVRHMRLPAGTDVEVVQRVMNQSMGVLVDEIRSSVDYFLAGAGGRSLSRAIITGGGSLLPQFAGRLSQAVRAPVIAGTPFSHLDTSASGLSPEQLSVAEPLASVPVGLALGALR